MSKRGLWALAGAGGAALLLTTALWNLRSRPELPPKPAGTLTVTRVSENRWRVPRALRDEYLKDKERVSRDIRLRPTPGAQPDAISELLIDRLTPESPAYAAGLRQKDRILMVNGSPVTTLGRAVNLVHEIQACSRLDVRIDRAGVQLEIRVDFE